jgi:hypothetical protein
MSEDDREKGTGTAAGLPYDWRKPTVERAKSRHWNSGDRRLFPPKSFGWGYALNFYWFVHPVQYMRGRRGSH